jgi:AGCS family alanine or glycine:cation symporter
MFNDIIDFINAINAVLWHDLVLYAVLGVGVLFTIWSGFCQYRSLTHGTSVIRGKYDDKNDPGAINHFQALSTALSGTVGLGNIAGVAVAVALGGPGAIFWMWIVGIVGMALKMTEVTQAMVFRDTSDPDNPRGGAMWVATRGFEKFGLKKLGVVIGFVFCITVIISTITGGNMFQSWSVGQITKTYFPSSRRSALASSSRWSPAWSSSAASSASVP